MYSQRALTADLDTSARARGSTAATTSTLTDGMSQGTTTLDVTWGTQDDTVAVVHEDSFTPHGPQVPLRVAVCVDDVKCNRELFGRLLARRGVGTVHFAEDGAQGAGLLDSLPPDAVSSIQAWFLDKEMPGCDGHECARRLRARGVTAPTIGVTGNALDEDRRAFLAAGAVAVVPEPVRVENVEAVLASVGLTLAPRHRPSAVDAVTVDGPGPHTPRADTTRLTGMPMASALPATATLQ